MVARRYLHHGMVAERLANCDGGLGGRPLAMRLAFVSHTGEPHTVVMRVLVRVIKSATLMNMATIELSMKGEATKAVNLSPTPPPLFICRERKW